MKLVDTRRHLFELVGAGLEGYKDPSLGHPADLIGQRAYEIRDEEWTTDYEAALREGACVISGLLVAYHATDQWSDTALALSEKGLL